MGSTSKGQHKAKPSSGGLRKYGRNKLVCARYRAEGRRERNRDRRMRRRGLIE